jgi:hypothetical protein
MDNGVNAVIDAILTCGTTAFYSIFRIEEHILWQRR